MSSKLNSPALELPINKNLVNDILSEILKTEFKKPTIIETKPEVKSTEVIGQWIPVYEKPATPTGFVTTRHYDDGSTTRVTNMPYYNSSSSGLYNTGNPCPGRNVLSNLLKEDPSVECYRDDKGLTYIRAFTLGFNMEFVNTQERAGFGRLHGHDHLYWVYKTSNKSSDYSLPIVNKRIRTQRIESKNKLGQRVKYTGDTIYFTAIENSTGKIQSKTGGRKTDWIIMRQDSLLW